MQHGVVHPGQRHPVRSFAVRERKRNGPDGRRETEIKSEGFELLRFHIRRGGRLGERFLPSRRTILRWSTFGFGAKNMMRVHTVLSRSD